MINFTENLYKTQWLEIVFQNRNKAYGAYALRNQNTETTLKALIYACVLFSALIMAPIIYNQIFGTKLSDKIIEPFSTIEVKLTKIQIVKPVPPVAKAPAKPVKLKSVNFSNLLVVPEEQPLSEPPTQQQLTEAVISSVDSEGIESSGLNPVEISTGVFNGAVTTEIPEENTTLYTLDGIETYPEFTGGHAAFVKYLNRNLRYPEAAVERGIQGKVLVSFIIEKDGQLSNIKIIRGIGNGCDEEAIRVLEKSPKWKPGIQNKQKVRVAYTLPINFSLP
ncbi:energy transducer TonB [Daejeonella rubra]|nr:energy transducer TonB [Daejeonella rubra]